MSFTTLNSILKRRASVAKDKTAYIEIASDGSTKYSLSNGELLERSLFHGRVLSAVVPKGERILLVFPSGLEFTEAFYGCLFAGLVSIPTHIPHPAFLKRTLPRLISILKNSGARFILTSAGVLSHLREAAKSFEEIHKIEWLVLEDLVSQSPPSLLAFETSPEELVAIQYTSGTLKEPKGVLLTHKNIIENTRQICAVTGLDNECRLLSWLPHSHDMGLIGGLFVPLVAGGLGLQMKTIDFIKSPLLWLQNLSRFQCDSSPAPNFAFELCLREVRKKPPQEIVNLHTLKILFNGAEPIRESTLKNFFGYFHDWGLSSTALYPCYGLAEATLMVTGAHGPRNPRIEKGPQGKSYVSSGKALPGHEVLIVDPQSLVNLNEGLVGEIWVHGPSISSGYWNNNTATENTFIEHHLTNSPNPKVYLRTRDLGFLLDHELFVIGRLDDIIILNGEKIHPEDLENTAYTVDTRLRPNGCAAFLCNHRDIDQVIVLAEIDHPSDLRTRSEVEENIRRAILIQHLVNCRVILVKAGSLPKTTSGKVQRTACRDNFIAGSYI